MSAHEAVSRGDRYQWAEQSAIEISVTRVARDQTWCDIFVYDNRTRKSWTKRQPLPFHTSFIKLPRGGA